MAHQEQSMNRLIQRIARLLGVVRVEDEQSHTENRQVLSAAHDEIDESRRRRAQLDARREEQRRRVRRLARPLR